VSFVLLTTYKGKIMKSVKLLTVEFLVANGETRELSRVERNYVLETERAVPTQAQEQAAVQAPVSTFRKAKPAVVTAKALGLRSNQLDSWKTVHEVDKLAADGMRTKDIATKLKRHPACVSSMRNRSSIYKKVPAPTKLALLLHPEETVRT
jgi:DNA-binding NarL/FixJ family response regulator